jgi:ribonucleoside-diphosphate reductase alpha chain
MTESINSKTFSQDAFKQYITNTVEKIKKFELSYYNMIDVDSFCNDVFTSMSDNMTSNGIMKLATDTASHKLTYEPDYEYLASTLAWSTHHKKVPKDIIKVCELMYENKNALNGKHEPRLKKEVFDFALKHKDILRKTVKYENDYKLSYFSYSTLCKSYFQKINDVIIETAQDLFMRVALGIHYKAEDIESVIKTYNSMSERYYIHATPTLFNAGTIYAQNSSCFLLTMQDSLDDIYEVIKRTALISKRAGGIGISIHAIRAKGTPIRTTGGHSKGIIPMLKVFNETARYCDQGGDKRKGSFAFYLSPCHAEIMEFLEVRLNHGPEEFRARDIFTALWIPDLFMKRVANNEMWSLFCPSKVKDKYGKIFEDTYGKEFEDMYVQAEKDGIYNRQIPAQQIYKAMIKSQMDCGLPYVLYSDSVNKKSNQKNIGVIRGSNLCTEIVEYTDSENDSVCNLASLSLPRYVEKKDNKLYFNFELLGEKTGELVVNLNRIIDVNMYPVSQAERCNKAHRPIGIGVSGLADIFAMFKYTWDCKEAKLLNRQIFETIYYYAAKKSSELGQSEGSYAFFVGSPMSQGILQCDMWNVKPITDYKWDDLRESCKKGMRNSLLVSPMPTASTAQILGNNESIEMFTNIIYSRKVLSGEFVLVNKHLVNDLRELKLWNKEMVDRIISKNGSIQSIESIPTDVKNIYKTVWEMSQKVPIDLAADRAPFVDQTQSLNIHIARPTIEKLSSLHMYTWKTGLKTGMYYLRTLGSRNAVQFTLMEKIPELQQSKETNNKTTKAKQFICKEKDDVCIMCSS